MDPADRLFAGLTGPEADARRDEGMQIGYEERCVRKILQYANLQIPHVGRARQDAYDKFGKRDLGFEWLEQTYPFPVRLASSKLRFTAKPRWTELFGSGFAKQPWFKAYHDMADALGWNVRADRCALIFNAPHADRASTMVLHNQPIQATIVVDPEQRTEPELRLIKPHGNPRIVYVIESFNSFMQTVGVAWADACRE